MNTYPDSPFVGQEITVGGTRKQCVSLNPTKWKNVTHGNHEERLQELESYAIKSASSHPTQLTLYVGDGQISTLTEALEKASLFVSTDSVSNYKGVTVLIKSGFVLEEQVNFEDVYFSGVTIKSEDPEVIIDRSKLVSKLGRWYPAFRFKNGVSPIFDCLFKMDDSGVPTERVNLYLINSRCHINPSAGFIDAGERNVDCTQGSMLIAPSAIFTGAVGVGVRVSTASSAFLQFADVSGSGSGINAGSGAVVSAADLVATDCLTTAISAQGGTSLELANADLSRAGTDCISAGRQTQVNAQDVIMHNPGDRAVYARNGAVVSCPNSDINLNSGTTGILSEGGSSVSCEGANITGGAINVFARRGGVVNASLSSLSAATSSSIISTEAGKVYALQAEFRKGLSDDTSDAVVSKGGEIYAVDKVSGGFSQIPNIRKGDGLIVTDDVVRNSGVATIAIGTNSVVVSHGLTVRPFSTEVQITPRNSLGSATKYWIAAADATTFTLFTDVDPATEDAEFSWRVEKFI